MHDTCNHDQNGQCCSCFGMLSVESRMKIYKHLKGNKKVSVSELVAHVGLTQPTISYHLREMKEAGLLESSRNGKEVYYEINYNCPVHKRECVLKGVQL